MTCPLFTDWLISTVLGDFWVHKHSQGGRRIDWPCTNHYKEDTAVAVVETGEASVGLWKCWGSRAFGGRWRVWILALLHINLESSGSVFPFVKKLNIAKPIFISWQDCWRCLVSIKWFLAHGRCSVIRGDHHHHCHSHQHRLGDGNEADFGA